jgi:hypothetical protein
MWDEYGLFANETTNTLPPVPIVEAKEIVKAWMQEWKQQHS